MFKKILKRLASSGSSSRNRKRQHHYGSSSRYKKNAITEVQVATIKNVAIMEVPANITLVAQVNVIIDTIHIMVAITIKRKDTLVQVDSLSTVN